MRLRILALRSLLLLLALSALASGPALQAQVRIPREALPGVAELQQVLSAGEQLERQRRWGEALLHYESAIREHPGQADLAERLMLARLHYDVARRYADSSFVDSLHQLGERDALDLYAEVLLKIHAHYVEQARWNDLVRRGATAMEVALREPAFLQRYGLTPENVAAARFINRLRQPRPIYSRHDARDAVAYFAELAHQQLGLPPAAVILEYACSAAASLDNYSTFLTGNQLDEVMSQIEGNFVGLGIELKADQQALLIVDVIRGGPADEAGLRSGERIVEVDGRATVDVSTDAAADMLKGPEGSQVALRVEAADGTPRRVVLPRRRVDVPSIEDAAIIDPQHGVAYLRLSCFQKTTNRDVESALWQLHRQGMRSLIVDVRGNPGGLLTASVEVADKFISEGSIVRTIGRSAGENFDYKAHRLGTWRVPLIVLIDGDSASAAEIFAAAIRDHRRGTIVGDRTYGKGSVQGIFPLNVSTAGVRLTTAKFYSPQGHAISHRGVAPDVVVRAAAKAVEGETPAAAEDVVLEAGRQLARQQLSQR